MATLARTTSLDRNLRYFDRSRALRLLLKLSPYTAVAVIANIATNESKNVQMLSSPQLAMDMYDDLEGEIQRSRAPGNTVARSWSNWLGEQGGVARDALSGEMSCG